MKLPHIREQIKFLHELQAKASQNYSETTLNFHKVAILKGKKTAFCVRAKRFGTQCHVLNINPAGLPFRA